MGWVSYTTVEAFWCCQEWFCRDRLGSWSFAEVCGLFYIYVSAIQILVKSLQTRLPEALYLFGCSPVLLLIKFGLLMPLAVFVEEVLCLTRCLMCHTVQWQLLSHQKIVERVQMLNSLVSWLWPRHALPPTSIWCCIAIAFSKGNRCPRIMAKIWWGNRLFPEDTVDLVCMKVWACSELLFLRIGRFLGLLLTMCVQHMCYLAVWNRTSSCSSLFLSVCGVPWVPLGSCHDFVSP